MRDTKGMAYRCRVNGACQTWKMRPEDFKLPVKYGLRNCFYVQNFTDYERWSNAHEWQLDNPVPPPKKRKLVTLRVAIEDDQSMTQKRRLFGDALYDPTHPV